MPTLSLDSGSHLGVPCRSALLGRVDRDGEKTSSDQNSKARKYVDVLIEVVVVARNVGPAAGASLHKGGDDCQSPTL